MRMRGGNGGGDKERELNFVVFLVPLVFYQTRGANGDKTGKKDFGLIMALPQDTAIMMRAWASAGTPRAGKRHGYVEGGRQDQNSATGA